MVAAFDKAGLARKNVREDSSYGLLGPYDGNIIGGLLMGVGLAMAGACPGTVLSQLGSGVTSGRYAAAGGVMGGITYVLIEPWLLRHQIKPKPGAGHALQDKIGANEDAVLAAFEVICATVLFTTTLPPPDGKWSLSHPLIGGLLIGGAQAMSLLFAKSFIGTSGAFEQVGQFVSDGLVTSNATRALPRAFIFGIGVVAGSALTSRYSPEATAPSTIAVSSALVGGWAVIVGARIAGGCTTGHGISGIATLSVSSFITMGATVLGSIIATFVLA